MNISVDGISLADAVFYKLYDLQGRIVFEKKNTTDIETDNIVIPVSPLARGSYMLKVTNDKYEYYNNIILR